MIEIKPVGSGSSGNCYIIDDGRDQVILDAGINFKKVQAAMNFDFSRLRAVLISHDHGDHSKYIKKFIDNTNVPIFATQGTLDILGLDSSNYRFKVVKPKETYSAGRMSILPFDVVHDAPEPVGYRIISSTGERLLYVTDTEYVKYRFKHITHMLVEMNYDQMIANDNSFGGRLNQTLKHRIMKTHFEKHNSLEFIKANKSADLKEVWLIHISKDNGDPKQFKFATQELTGVPVYIAAEEIS